MRAKTLSAVYTAFGVQHFILGANLSFTSVTDVAWIATEAVVIVGASILASDVTHYLVEKVRPVLFDRPLWRGGGGSSPPAAPSASTQAPAAPAQTASSPKGEKDGKGEKHPGEFESALTSAAAGGAN